MGAKKNVTGYIKGTKVGAHVGRHGGYHGRIDRSSDCYEFCMSHYADDIECMRRNEWSDDEEETI